MQKEVAHVKQRIKLTLKAEKENNHSQNPQYLKKLCCKFCQKNYRIPALKQTKRIIYERNESDCCYF